MVMNKLSPESIEKAAIAIEEHYWPNSDHPDLPSTVEGTILAIADRLDTLIQFEKMGYKPTSSKDPLGMNQTLKQLIRLLTESPYKIDISLYELLEMARDADQIQLLYDKYIKLQEE